MKSYLSAPRFAGISKGRYNHKDLSRKFHRQRDHTLDDYTEYSDGLPPLDGPKTYRGLFPKNIKRIPRLKGRNRP